MEQNARPCPHDCRKCAMQQQIFCTAQMTFNSYEQMNAMKGQLEELSKKVEAIQSSEAELSIPMSGMPFKAQSETGAESRVS